MFTFMRKAQRAKDSSYDVYIQAKRDAHKDMKVLYPPDRWQSCEAQAYKLQRLYQYYYNH